MRPKGFLVAVEQKFNGDPKMFEANHHQIKATEGTNPFVPSVVSKPAISVIGLGYVGAVSMACLSDLGHEVVGIDIDVTKVERIAMGKSPIVEAELEELLTNGVNEALISATTDPVTGIAATDITFVSVGTPTAADGGCDTTYVSQAAVSIGRALALKDDYHVVVMRCSIPPGTTLDLMVPEIEKISGKKMGPDFGVCFNPEFLREGTAVADFRDPPKTVIGANDPRAAEVLAGVYRPVDDNVIITTIAVAEMVKYVDNVWHAAKVTFANEVGRLCKSLTIDSHDVMDIFVQDLKLNLSPYYLKPGFAFGGSCLPKEVRAVSHIAKERGIELPLVDSLVQSNNTQIALAHETIKAAAGDTKRIGFLGVTFKPGTDDLRESPTLELISWLMDEGYEVSIYDPHLRTDDRLMDQYAYVAHAKPHLKPVMESLAQHVCKSAWELAEQVDVLVATYRNDEFGAVIERYLGNCQVVDLVRIQKDVPDSPAYHGLCW